MISDSIKVQDTNNEVLQNQILESLSNSGYKGEVQSATINNLEFSVNHKNLETKAMIERNPHKPFILSLRVDSTNIDSIKKYNQHRMNTAKKTQKESGGSYFKYYIFFIILTTAVTIFFNVLSFFFSDSTQYLIFFGTLLVGVIIYFFVKPSLKSKKKIALQIFDQHVFNIIKSSLESITGENKTQKCWNCFAEMNFTDSFCQNCGK